MRIINISELRYFLLKELYYGEGDVKTQRIRYQATTLEELMTIFLHVSWSIYFKKHLCIILYPS